MSDGRRPVAPRRALAGGAALVVALGLVGLTAQARADQAHPASSASLDLGKPLPGAAYLEARLRAPCCWNQTLDTHRSETSDTLRREIRARLEAGESKEAIEAAMVARYGERILATPNDSPIVTYALALAAGVVVAGAAAGAMVARWRRQSSTPTAARGDAPRPRDELDERIDRELEDL
ncbi:MAG: cytochrome c-type biogenesis protein CcmH [Polyangiaceae bacterium]|nr:cytochrome c-type biogenesis protein CcmH [Polyangiaceae bacterium]